MIGTLLVSLRNYFGLALLVIAMWLSGSTPLCSQSIYGSITGKVSDPAGAAIVGAKVEALNQDLGSTRTTETNNQGIYLFPTLEPGTYTITATSAQFVAAKNENVSLLARDTARSDLQMQIQGANERVEVNDTQLVASIDPTQSSSTSGQEINSLALNFRATANPSPIVVANLAPNVQSDTSGILKNSQ